MKFKNLLKLQNKINNLRIKLIFCEDKFKIYKIKFSIWKTKLIFRNIKFGT
jgi:hypothetical protein